MQVAPEKLSLQESLIQKSPTRMSVLYPHLQICIALVSCTSTVYLTARPTIMEPQPCTQSHQRQTSNTCEYWAADLRAHLSCNQRDVNRWMSGRDLFHPRMPAQLSQVWEVWLSWDTVIRSHWRSLHNAKRSLRYRHLRPLLAGSIPQIFFIILLSQGNFPLL